MPATYPAFLSSAVANDPTLPQIAYSSAYRPYEFERLASEHWILDKGDSSCLIGGVNNGVLTPAGTAPSYSSGYLTVPDGQNGLISPYVDAQTQTQWCVFKKADLGVKTSALLFGAYSTISEEGGDYTARENVIITRARVTSGSGALNTSGNSAIPDGTWVFVATATGPAGRITYIGGQGVATDARIKVARTDSKKCALGNNAYSQSGYDGGNIFAEYGILTGVILSTADLDLIYARAKIRAARRGITLL